MQKALHAGQSGVCLGGLCLHAAHGLIGRAAACVVALASILQRLQLSRPLLRSMLGGIGTKMVSGPFRT
jgi:hypothetical protein